jgi:hypothetical protein
MTGYRFFVLAWLTAGTLDLLSAFVFMGLGEPHLGPLAVLRGVAAGPFGDHMENEGAFGALIGLLVHFTLMANMTAVLVLAARAFPALRRQPVVIGLAYGLLLYLVMYCGVLPLRYPDYFPHGAAKIAKALFSHLICVGMPMSLLAMRGFRRD